MIDEYEQKLPHGITLVCRAAGEKGRPVLMFLHGFPEAAFVWDGLLQHFALPKNGGYRCIAPNLRGFGGSSAPTEVAAYRSGCLVQDVTALMALEGVPIDCLVAHDWGGAVAWRLAASQPSLLKKLAIVNSPHPGIFLRELQHSPSQRAASAYMNFLIRPDAQELLAADDFRQLWRFFATPTQAGSGLPAWLTPHVRAQYRHIWQRGLNGALNYYRASPLHPATPDDPGAACVSVDRQRLIVHVPTLVVWGMADTALPAALLEGLADYVPNMQTQRIEGASHWLIHEQPERITAYLQHFLQQQLATSN